MLRLFISFVACLLFAVMGAKPLIACGCGQISVEKKYEWARLVFFGEIVGAHLKEPFPLDPEQRRMEHPVLITANALEFYKGDEAELVEVTSAATEASCGVEVRVGGLYIFFVSETGEINMCSTVKTDWSKIREARIPLIELAKLEEG